MYSQGEIEEAVAAGALQPDQAASLRAFVAARNDTPTADEEYYGLYRGFNDWFVLYTVLITLLALGWLGSLIPVGSGGRSMGPGGAPIAAPLFVAAASWGLAELFTRLRHTALASVTLAFTFGLGVLLTLIFILAPVMDGRGPAGSVIGGLCCFLAAAASWVYWRRFRQPATQMVIAGLAVLGVIAFMGGSLGPSSSAIDVINILAFLMGIATFAYAMWWDKSDPWRVTDRNESGLWLHGLASALLIFPIAYFTGFYRGTGTIGGAFAFLLIFALFAFLALAVNRKVYLLSAISPLIVALNFMIQGGRSGGYSPYGDYGGYPGTGGYGGYGSTISPYGAPPNPFMPFGGTVVTLLIVSLIMLAMAFWWAPLRRIVSNILPENVRAMAPVVDAAPQGYAAPTEPPPPPEE